MQDQNARAQNRATLNTPLHQTANAIAKKAFLKHMGTLQKGDEVLVTVGGSGAGKGFALKNIPKALELKKKSKIASIDVEDIAEITKYDPWFLGEIAAILAVEAEIEADGLPSDAAQLHRLKRMGFADARIAKLARARKGDPLQSRACQRRRGGRHQLRNGERKRSPL